MSEAPQMSNFVSDRHALYVGWVMGIAVRNNLNVRPILDPDGNYTDSFTIELPNFGPMVQSPYLPLQPQPQVTLTVIIPPPPDDWEL